MVDVSRDDERRAAFSPGLPKAAVPLTARSRLLRAHARTRSAGGVLGARLGAFIDGSERLSGSGSGSEHEGSSFSSRGRSDVRTTDSLVRQPAAPADARRHGNVWPAGRDAARLD